MTLEQCKFKALGYLALTNLLNICGDLLAVWDGVAATSFNDYLQEAGAPLQNLINFLEESKINLNQAADNYDEAESSNTIR